MLNRIFITFFILTGAVFFEQASSRMMLPIEIPEFDDPVPTEVRAKHAARPARNTSIPTEYALEKYPFSKNYKEAYRYRTNVPNARIVDFINNMENETLRINNPAKYLETLCRLIQSSTRDPFEKVKMVYDATALLLDYDTEAVKLPFIPVQTWEQILVSRKTVCEGYADFFKKLCDMLNIPCEKVPGFAQGGLLPLTPNKDLTANHAWNIVQINNFWYNIDCTWGSSSADVLTQTQKKKYSTDWLFLNGDYFRYTHFPSDSNFQLASPKINEEQFKTLPRLEPSFFDRLKLLTPLKSVNDIESTFKIKLQKKDDTKIQILFYDYNSGYAVQNKTLQNQKDDTLSVTFNAPQAGTYLGTVMYNTEGNAYRGCAFFFVQAKNSNNIQYPVPLKSSAKDVEIISPLVALKADSSYDFKVKVSNKKYLIISCNGKITRMKSEGNGTFTQRFTIPYDAKSITISASDTEYGQYEGIVKYFIEN